jgi:CIC family chloride channel protein
MRRLLSKSAEIILHKFGENGLLIYISILIGTAGGIVAVSLDFSVHLIFHKLFSYFNTFWGFIIPGLGAALSIIFLKYFVKDDQGHGIPGVLFSITRKGGIMRKRDMFSRFISALLTVAAGGSAGLEGPIVFTGSAMGSNLSTLFKLTEKHRIILIGSGTAAGISAIFNAPLTGIVFALEVMLSEWSVKTIIPTSIAAVTATQISRVLLGNTITFKVIFEGMNSVDLLLIILLGIITGFISVLFSRGLEMGESLFKKISSNQIIRALSGGILVGLIFKLTPETLGEGHDYIQQMISGDQSLHKGIFLLCTILILKYFGTIFTLSSGGSGGIFTPSLFLGASAGIIYGNILNLFSLKTLASPHTYSLVGMAGVIAGVLQAPLTGIFLISEVTNGYNLILPLILVSIVSMIISSIFQDGSIYTKQLIKTRNLIRTGSDNRILAELDLQELLETDCTTVTENLILKDLIEEIKKSSRNQFIVISADSKKYLGIIYIHQIRHILFEHQLYNMITVSELMRTDIPIIKKDSSLNQIIPLFEQERYFTLPCIDPDNGQYLGLISKATLFSKYRQELIVQTL